MTSCSGCATSIGIVYYLEGHRLRPIESAEHATRLLEVLGVLDLVCGDRAAALVEPTPHRARSAPPRASGPAPAVAPAAGALHVRGFLRRRFRCRRARRSRGRRRHRSGAAAEHVAGVVLELVPEPSRACVVPLARRAAPRDRARRRADRVPGTTRPRPACGSAPRGRAPRGTGRLCARVRRWSKRDSRGRTSSARTSSGTSPYACTEWWPGPASIR